MGENLKGKEIGKGICQRKDGLYVARFVNRYGNRTVKCFPTVPKARNWLDEARYADSHEDVFVASEMTVDEWFNFWIENIVGDLAPNTRRNYCERYNRTSSVFVCTLYGTHTQQERLSEVFSRRCCRNCLVTQASKQRWIGMLM